MRKCDVFASSKEADVKVTLQPGYRVKGPTCLLSKAKLSPGMLRTI